MSERIDALVAEHIMDLEIGDDGRCRKDGSCKWSFVEPYSTDIKAALEAFEHVKARNETFEIYLENSHETDYLWKCSLMWLGPDADGAPDFEVSGSDKILATAICKAMLMILDIEVPDE